MGIHYVCSLSMLNMRNICIRSNTTIHLRYSILGCDICCILYLHFCVISINPYYYVCYCYACYCCYVCYVCYCCCRCTCTVICDHIHIYVDYHYCLLLNQATSVVCCIIILSSSSTIGFSKIIIASRFICLIFCLLYPSYLSISISILLYMIYYMYVYYYMLC